MIFKKDKIGDLISEVRQLRKYVDHGEEIARDCINSLERLGRQFYDESPSAGKHLPRGILKTDLLSIKVDAILKHLGIELEFKQQSIEPQHFIVKKKARGKCK